MTTFINSRGHPHHHLGLDQKFGYHHFAAEALWFITQTIH